MGVCPIHWNYAHIIFLAPFASQGVLNKDPTIWLGGTRPPPISLITAQQTQNLINSVPAIKLSFG